MAATDAKSSQKHMESHFPADDDDKTNLSPTPLFPSNSECDVAADQRADGFYSPTNAVHIPLSNETVDVTLESIDQPKFQHHKDKDFAVGWAKALQDEVDDSSISIARKTTLTGEHQNIEELDYQFCKNYVATDLPNFDGHISKHGENVSFDPESHWTGTEKTKPWWQSASKDELVSLVALKSLGNLENCDLPQPRTKHQSKDQPTCLECLDQDCFPTSSFTDTQFSSSGEHKSDLHPSGCMGDRRLIVGNVDLSLHHQDHFSISETGNEENNSSSMSNLNASKAQLLEALCHSQTRAREAEKAAQAADTEKNHIVGLFLRQAAQLFAYKQWFRLLQLENVCLQLRNRDRPVTGLFSDVFPWVPCKDRQFDRTRNRRKKRGRERRKFAMYEIAFAVGLGLAGASLLLGWTAGWLVPIF